MTEEERQAALEAGVLYEGSGTPADYGRNAATGG